MAFTNLFNDAWYKRASQYVENTILEEEHLLYRQGKIRDLYESFDHLLLDNLDYYNRILRTVMFMYENKIINNGELLESNTSRNKRWLIKLTPTKLYYLATVNKDSLHHEITLAFPKVLETHKNIRTLTFAKVFDELQNYSVFKLNLSISTKYANTNSFQLAFENDITDSTYLSRVIANLTDDALCISSKDLNESLQVIPKILEHERVLLSNFGDLYADDIKADIRNFGILFSGQASQYQITYEPTEFMGNKSYRFCMLPVGGPNWFNIHEKLLPKSRMIHEWSNKMYSTLNNNSFALLESIFSYVAQMSHRNFIAIRYNIDKSLRSIVYLKKKWSIYYLHEECYFRGERFMERTLAKGKLSKIAKALFDNDYFTFGKKDDIEFLEFVSRNISHYPETSAYTLRTYLDYLMSYVDESALTIDTTLDLFDGDKKAIMLALDFEISKNLEAQYYAENPDMVETLEQSEVK